LTTLAYLVLSFVVILLIARLLSKLLKKRVLTRFGFDKGTQESIAVIFTYLVAFLGVLIIMQSFGINISSLTVFAGALGIGFGIALQDLASNFISGITILMDRAIRVGDFIEVDHLLGTVERISIRSIVVRTIHNVFVIVPNNRFVRENVINWSYKDPRCRLTLPINFPDDLDPIHITEALIAAAYQEPRVLPMPSPHVWFKGYGEGTIDFELLVWIDNPPDTSLIKSNIYYHIAHEIKMRNIETAAPQRNLCVRHPESLFPFIHETVSALQGTAKTEAASEKGKKSGSSALLLTDLLRKVDYFKNLTDFELLKIIESGYRKNLKALQILFNEGDPGDAFYIILSGEVEVFVPKINRKLAVLEKGNFFGELALILGIPRTASVRALKPTVLFCIHSEGFERLLKNHTSLYLSIIEELEEHKEELAQRQKELREMGLLDEDEDDDNVVTWVTKRIKKLFSLG
jgi:potassium efflux system protein